MKFSLLAALQEPGNISIAFQPIFELADRPNPIHALDASIRGPQGTHFESSNLLLEYVRRKKAEPLIDRDLVSAACRAAEQLPGNSRIHLPIHVATLAQNQGFVSHLELQAKNHGVDLSRLTVEFVESPSAANFSSAPVVLEALRRLGVRIGLKDVGLGNSAWHLLLEHSPDYWKLDPYLVKGVTDDFKKRLAIEALLDLSKRFGSLVIASGIDSAEDLATLAMIGVQLVEADFLCQAVSVDALRRAGVFSDSSEAIEEDRPEGPEQMFA
jgi:EAL domain-containing protein (putative c-di-GMP-specific phosphodiesterase class I)